MTAFCNQTLGSHYKPDIMNKVPYPQEKSKRGPMNNAPLFKQIFSPYCEKHIYQKQTPSLFGDAAFLEWQTAEQPLTDSKINRAIASKLIIGYFMSVCTRCFSLDIDDHTGKGEGYLLSIYQNICKKLTTPSLICKTPHGLHAFYFLSHPVPEILLIAQARRALQNVPVEVKPTNAVGLRIPAEKDLLDPCTFNPLNRLFEDAVNAASVYHPIELFGAGIMPDAVVESLKERQSKAVKIRTWKSIACAEEEYGKYGIQSGTTNAVLCELIPIYRSAGLTAQEAAAEFAALLAPDYDGELRRNPRRLQQRVNAFYKNPPETRFNTLPKQAEVGLFTEIIAETIAALLTGPAETRQQKSALTQRRRTVKKAVALIESWKLYLDSVISSKQFLEMWNYLYPYFKKNTKEGYYPLSSNILKKVHENYERWILPFLLEVGYLERSPYKYSSVYGICYYYKINGERFITDTPRPQPKPKRISKAQARADQIRAYKREHPKATVRAIAEAFHISKSVVGRYLLKK